MLQQQALSNRFDKWMAVGYFLTISMHALDIKHIHLLHALLWILRGLCFVVAIHLLFKKKIYFNRFHGVVFLYLVWLVLVSIVSQSDGLVSVPAFFITISSYLILFQFQYQYQPEGLLRSQLWAFAAYVWVSLVLVILFPDGMWMNEYGSNGKMEMRYLVGGNYNQLGPIFLCACVTALCYDLRYGTKTFWYLFVISFAQLIIVGSKTSIVGFVLLLVVQLIKSTAKKYSYAKTLMIVFVVYQLFVTFFFDIFTSFEWVRYIVVDLLNKDLSFTNRTFLWDTSKYYISKHPIVGYGRLSVEWYRFYFGNANPHNFVLMCFMTGGTVLFAILLFLYNTVMSSFRKHRTIEGVYFTVGLAVLLIMMVTEVYSFYYLIYLMCNIYYSAYLINPIAASNSEHGCFSERERMNTVVVSSFNKAQ